MSAPLPLPSRTLVPFAFSCVRRAPRAPSVAGRSVSRCSAARGARRAPAGAVGGDRTGRARRGVAAWWVPAGEAHGVGSSGRGGGGAARHLSGRDRRRRTRGVGGRIANGDVRMGGGIPASSRQHVASDESIWRLEARTWPGVERRHPARDSCVRSHECAPVRRGAALFRGVRPGGAGRRRGGGDGNRTPRAGGAGWRGRLRRAHRPWVDGGAPHHLAARSARGAVASRPVRRSGRAGGRAGGGAGPCAGMERTRRTALPGGAL